MDAELVQGDRQVQSQHCNVYDAALARPLRRLPAGQRCHCCFLAAIHTVYLCFTVSPTSSFLQTANNSLPPATPPPLLTALLSIVLR